MLPSLGRAKVVRLASPRLPPVGSVLLAARASFLVLMANNSFAGSASSSDDESLTIIPFELTRLAASLKDTVGRAPINALVFEGDLGFRGSDAAKRPPLVAPGKRSSGKHSTLSAAAAAVVVVWAVPVVVPVGIAVVPVVVPVGGRIRTPVVAAALEPLPDTPLPRTGVL